MIRSLRAPFVGNKDLTLTFYNAILAQLKQTETNIMKKFLIASIALALPFVASANSDQTALNNFSDINPSFMTSQAGNMNNSQININQGAYSIIGGDQCANTTITGGVTYNRADSDAFQPLRAENQSDNKGAYLGFQMAVGEVNRLCEQRAQAHVEIQRRKMNEDQFAFCGRIYSTLRDPNAPVFDLAVLRRNKDVRQCLDMVDERASFPRLFAGASGYHTAMLDRGAQGVQAQREKATIKPKDVDKVELSHVEYSEYRVQVKIVHKQEHVEMIKQHMDKVGYPKHTRFRVIEFVDGSNEQRYSLNISGFTSLQQAYEYAKFIETEHHVHWIKVAGSKLKG